MKKAFALILSMLMIAGMISCIGKSPENGTGIGTSDITITVGEPDSTKTDNTSETKEPENKKVRSLNTRSRCQTDKYQNPIKPKRYDNKKLISTPPVNATTKNKILLSVGICIP